MFSIVRVVVVVAGTARVNSSESGVLGLLLWHQAGAPQPARAVVSNYETVLSFATPVSPACMPGVLTVM